jgi:hypothetical protein
MVARYRPNPKSGQEVLLELLTEQYRHGNSVCKMYADLLVDAMAAQEPVLQSCDCYLNYHNLKEDPKSVPDEKWNSFEVKQRKIDDEETAKIFEEEEREYELREAEERQRKRALRKNSAA